VDWPTALFYAACTVTPVLFAYHAFDACGVFKFINRKLNGDSKY
jgi:hypothetical protein